MKLESVLCLFGYFVQCGVGGIVIGCFFDCVGFVFFSGVYGICFVFYDVCSGVVGYVIGYCVYVVGYVVCCCFDIGSLLRFVVCIQCDQVGDCDGGQNMVFYE